MKSKLMIIGLVVFGIIALLLAMSLVGCKKQAPIPPKVEMAKPAPAPVPQPKEEGVCKDKEVCKIPTLKPYILTATETVAGRVWQIKLNKVAQAAMKNGAEVRVNVGYCWYRGTVSDMNNGIVRVTADWSPGGKVTAGVWQNGTYITSVVISEG